MHERLKVIEYKKESKEATSAEILEEVLEKLKVLDEGLSTVLQDQQEYSDKARETAKTASSTEESVQALAKASDYVYRNSEVG